MACNRSRLRQLADELASNKLTAWHDESAVFTLNAASSSSPVALNRSSWTSVCLMTSPAAAGAVTTLVCVTWSSPKRSCSTSSVGASNDGVASAAAAVVGEGRAGGFPLTKTNEFCRKVTDCLVTPLWLLDCVKVTLCSRAEPFGTTRGRDSGIESGTGSGTEAPITPPEVLLAPLDNLPGDRRMKCRSHPRLFTFLYMFWRLVMAVLASAAAACSGLGARLGSVDDAGDAASLSAAPWTTTAPPCWRIIWFSWIFCSSWKLRTMLTKWSKLKWPPSSPGVCTALMAPMASPASTTWPAASTKSSSRGSSSSAPAFTITCRS